MSPRLLASLVVVLLAVPAAGQQTGNANRNYSINGVGVGGTSVIMSTVATLSNVTNQYDTLDPFSPVAWAVSSTSTIGWYQSATNSVDIGPSPLIFLGNGADPGNPLSSFFFTSAGGSLTLTVPAPASLANSAWYFAMAHAAASSPDGFWVSPTHLVTFTADPNLSLANITCNPGASPLALTDDSYSQQALNFSFPFFGVTYSNCYVGSNGYVTFASGQTSFSESVSGLLSGPPRISEWWDDLNPGSGGSVTFFTDGIGSFEVCFTNVPEFGTSNSNSFKVTAVAGILITVDYALNMASNDGLVGLSPGNNAASGLALNLSIGNNTIGPGQAPYELFTGNNDLKGYQVSFVLDPTGTPFAQL